MSSVTILTSTHPIHVHVLVLHLGDLELQKGTDRV